MREHCNSIDMFKSMMINKEDHYEKTVYNQGRCVYYVQE